MRKRLLKKMEKKQRQDVSVILDKLFTLARSKRHGQK
jgi:hypothetical protein